MIKTKVTQILKKLRWHLSSLSKVIYEEQYKSIQFIEINKNRKQALGGCVSQHHPHQPPPQKKKGKSEMNLSSMSDGF